MKFRAICFALLLMSFVIAVEAQESFKVMMEDEK